MRTGLLTAAALAAVLIVGCKKEDAGTMNSGSSNTGSGSSSSGSSGGMSSTGPAMGTPGMMGGAPTTMPSTGMMGMPATRPSMGMPATAPAAGAMDALKDMAAQKASELQQKAGEAKDKASDATAPAAGGMQEQAQKLIEQVNGYLKDGKLDMADSALTKLDGMKGSLSPEWQGRIDTLKSTVAAAKKTNIQIPGLK